MNRNEPQYDEAIKIIEGDGRRNEACTVMLWDHFIEMPGLLHPEFERGYIQGSSYEGVLDLTRGIYDEWATTFEAHSVNGLMRISQCLSTRCLLFRTYVEHERVTRVTDKSWNTERWTDELAVLINTDHPAIRDHLRTKLEQAKTDVANGRKFSLRLDFKRGLRNWYGAACSGSTIRFLGSFYDQEYETDKVKNINVYILNCSKPVSFYMSKWAIIGCFPCWLLTGGCCYYIHRKKSVDDVVQKFNYPVRFEGRGAEESEDTPICGCGKIYHLPVSKLQTYQTYEEDLPKSLELKWKHRRRNQNPWTEEEKRAVLDHFARHIRHKIIPEKIEIVICLQEEPALIDRSWKDVREFCNLCILKGEEPALNNRKRKDAQNMCLKNVDKRDSGHSYSSKITTV